MSTKQVAEARSDPLFGTGNGSNGPGLSRTKYTSVQSDDEYQLVNFLRQLYTRAVDRRKPRYNTWSRNYRMLTNLAQGELSRGYNPRDSEIYPTLSSLVAWMTDPNTMVDVFPVADPSSEYFPFVLNLSNDMSNIIYSTWQVENYDAQIKLQLWDAFLYGVGINKTIWDNSLADGYGNGVFRRVDPWTFYPDPDSTSNLDAEYFVEVQRISPEELVRRYPHCASYVDELGTGEAADDQRPEFLGGSRSIEASSNLGALPLGSIGKWKYSDGTSRHGAQTPSIVLYEYWIKQNKGKTTQEYPSNEPSARPDSVYAGDWRCICIASNRVVFDEWASDLWSHSQHPYDRYVFDDIGEYYGIALVDHLAYPQAYINRLLAALQQNAELVGNPVLIEPQVGGTSRTRITNQPGQRIPLQGNSINNKPEWLIPPEMPQFIMNLVSFWISRIENISGLSAIVRGATPNQRNSEGVIESVQEAAFVRVRSSQRNLEKMLESAAVKLADLIVDNYTEPRIMAILGPDSQQTAVALRARHFQVPNKYKGIPWKYALQIRGGSNFPTSRQARIAEATQLFTLGAIDDEALLSAYGWPHYPEMLERKYAKMATGQFQPPGARQRAGH